MRCRSRDRRGHRPPNALDIRMTYSSTLDDNLEPLAQCPVVADKYNIKEAKARLYSTLARTNVAQSLQMYRLPIRVPRPCGFRLPASPLGPPPRNPRAPQRFRVHPRHRHHTKYLEAVVEVVDRTPLKSRSLSWHAGGFPGLFRSLGKGVRV
jgi:hypothetical protein